MMAITLSLINYLFEKNVVEEDNCPSVECKYCTGCDFYRPWLCVSHGRVTLIMSPVACTPPVTRRVSFMGRKMKRHKDTKFHFNILICF